MAAVLRQHFVMHVHRAPANLAALTWPRCDVCDALRARHQSHQTHCQVEAHLHYSKLISHAPEGGWAKMAPFRILSVDIECQGRKVM